MNEKQYQNARAGNGHNGENFAFSGNTHHSVIFENDAHSLLQNICLTKWFFTIFAISNKSMN